VMTGYEGMPKEIRYVRFLEAGSSTSGSPFSVTESVTESAAGH
jgi:hypothetical protein